MAGYGPGFVRPVLETNNPTVVEYRLLIHELIELSTREQKFKINARLRVSWRDEFLQWEPSEYGDTKVIFLPASSIWQPDITLMRNIDEDFEVMKPTSVRVNSTGHVSWFTLAFLSSSCDVNVRYFPFDIQRCEMRFSSWSYSIEDIDLYLAKSKDAQQTSYQENGIWDLVEVQTAREVKSYIAGDYPEVSYTFVLKRRSEYYYTNVVVPFLFLSLICNLIFLLPPAGKDAKVTLVITNLLALIVFLQIVAGVMPPVGEIPVLATYFLTLIILVCISIVMTIFVYTVQHGSDQPPRWFRRVVLGFMARAVCMYDSAVAGFDEKGVSENEELQPLEVNANKDGANLLAVQIPQSLLDDVAYLRNKVESQEKGDFFVLQWEYASRVIDRWLLIISMTVWALATIILLAVSHE
ncbi:neuronal acetylcholine receptor subunit alpha-7-like isoform X2 [Acanthaster planci]|nr:neuronal acetylcholine receptor subunit alpha-7-like isoform X2 [Acanthaster planci]XP_022108840.1 neuronal acetylcholine receptor subunit alpha-7-like isoform X2 [Acanthaster planci]